MATNAAGYGSNHSFSAATLYRLHQVGAPAFDQIAERTVRGVEPLRVTTGRGMPLQLSTQGARMNARLKQRVDTPAARVLPGCQEAVKKLSRAVHNEKYKEKYQKQVVKHI